LERVEEVAVVGGQAGLSRHLVHRGFGIANEEFVDVGDAVKKNSCHSQLLTAVELSGPRVFDNPSHDIPHYS
jgi:hypothetical protein